MKCKNCGNAVQENWAMCPFCGTTIEKKKLCAKCGAELQPNWAMCPFCGEKVGVPAQTSKLGSADLFSGVGQATSILPSFDDILPDDSSLDLVAGDIAEAQQRQQEAQNAEYQKKLNFARIACIREQYAQAQEIYDNLAQDDPTDINAYIGYVRIATKNYTQYQGVEVEKAIRVVEQVGCDVSENNLDKEYRDYLAKRKAEFDRIAAEEARKKKAEAERKAKEEAERKAREEAERKAREEAERKAKEEAERKAKEDAERKAKEEAERKKRELSKNFDVNGTTLVKYKGKEKEVVIPDGIKCIGEDAFSYCSSLKSITIPNSVTSIGEHAFFGCSSLTNITIPNSVTSIEGAVFSCCQRLSNIVVEQGNKAYKSIGGHLFTKDGKTLVRYCEGKAATHFTIPDSVTSIGESAFFGCGFFTSITIPNSVTSIGANAFFECSSLTSITIPNSVTSIGMGAFNGCRSLTSITIPSSVKSMGNYVFSECSSLTSITIPNSVTSIGKWVFYESNSLKKVYAPRRLDLSDCCAPDGCQIIRT